MNAETRSPEKRCGGEICTSCNTSIKINRQKRIQRRKEKKLVDSKD